MKLKSLKVALAVALAAPLMFAAGMAQADASDPDTTIRIVDEVQGDVGQAGNMGDVRVLNYPRFNSASCSSHNGRPTMDGAYTDNDTITAQIAAGNRPHIAVRYDPDTNSDTPARWFKAKLGSLGAPSDDVKFKLNMGGTVGASDSIRIELLSGETTLSASTCSVGQSCWPSNTTTPTITVHNSSSKDADGFRVSGDGGTFDRGCQIYPISSIDVTINGGTAVNTSFQ